MQMKIKQSFFIKHFDGIEIPPIFVPFKRTIIETLSIKYYLSARYKKQPLSQGIVAIVKNALKFARLDSVT